MKMMITNWIGGPHTARRSKLNQSLVWILYLWKTELEYSVCSCGLEFGTYWTPLEHGKINVSLATVLFIYIHKSNCITLRCNWNDISVGQTACRQRSCGRIFFRMQGEARMNASALFALWTRSSCRKEKHCLDSEDSRSEPLNLLFSWHSIPKFWGIAHASHMQSTYSLD